MITLEVFGDPAPQGSKRGVLVGKKGGPKRALVIDANPVGAERTKTWRTQVADACPPGRTVVDGPVGIEVTFWLPRPKSISVRARRHPSVKPDADKLLRSTFDALTGVVWRDDALVVDVLARKRYADERPATPDRPGASIAVWPVTP